MAQVSTFRKWPIGAAVNKYKKDMAKNFTEPKSVQMVLLAFLLVLRVAFLRLQAQLS